MIGFFEEDIKVNLKVKRKLKHWLQEVAALEGKKVLQLNYVFCSDAYLLEMNQAYLKHETLTDIITFDQSENPGIIEGDVYISYERVQENAKKFDSESDELYRVMVHGLLHLCGYKDKKPGEVRLMREKEQHYLKHLERVSRETK